MSAGSHYRHHYRDMLLLDGSYRYEGTTKPRTTWKRQGQSTPTNDFDGNTIDYDSSSVQFGGTGQSPAGVIKQKTDWKKRG
jgi:hypothetical protein